MLALVLVSLLLGLIQGITELLPISSSGHLLLAHELFSQTENTLALDAVLHLATALALLIYFRHDWQAMLPRRDTTSDVETLSQSPTFYLLAIATFPAALTGFFLQDLIATHFRSPWVVVIMLILIGLLMILVEFKNKQPNLSHLNNHVIGKVRKSSHIVNHSNLCKRLTFTEALFIGCLQAVALIPGTSRSGITIVAGMLVGLSRAEAARFAFLLGTPITLGAGLLKLPDLLSSIPSISSVPFVLLSICLSFTTAFFSGLLSIHWFLKFLNSHSLRPFALYRLLLAALTTLALIK